MHTQPGQPHQRVHAADQFIGRKNAAQHRDRDVRLAILIDVHHGGMRRHLKVRAQDSLFEEPTAGLAVKNDAVARAIAYQNIIQAVLVEVEYLNVGYAGGPIGRRCPDRQPLESRLIGFAINRNF